jgi:hypothetical protein
LTVFFYAGDGFSDKKQQVACPNATKSRKSQSFVSNISNWLDCLMLAQTSTKNYLSADHKEYSAKLSLQLPKQLQTKLSSKSSAPMVQECA